MKILNGNRQLILRPSEGNGFDFRIETFGGFDLGIKIGFFNRYPYICIWLPFLALSLERFNSAENDRLERFFSVDEES